MWLGFSKLVKLEKGAKCQSMLPKAKDDLLKCRDFLITQRY